MSDQLTREESHEIRKLRWQNKQLGKALGKAGERIHQLRGELAEARSINDKIARGEVRRLESMVESQRATVQAKSDVITSLQAQLAEKASIPHPAVEDWHGKAVAGQLSSQKPVAVIT